MFCFPHPSTSGHAGLRANGYVLGSTGIRYNDFAIAEEVSLKGENKKRPDIVIYVNGIALGVLELKRVGEGIRQNLDNQKKAFKCRHAKLGGRPLE